MITKAQLLNNIKTYLYTQINDMSKDFPVINFMKPMLSRGIENNIWKLESALNFLVDKEGYIDIENILKEMEASFMTAQPFTFNVPLLGDIEIGGGLIMFNLPLVNKRLVLDREDIAILKEMLMTKS